MSSSKAVGSVLVSTSSSDSIQYGRTPPLSARRNVRTGILVRGCEGIRLTLRTDSGRPAVGSSVLISAANSLPDLPKPLQSHIATTPDWTTAPDFQAVLFEGDSDALRDLNRQLATRPGAIVAAQGINRDALASGAQDYALVPLVEEQSVSTDTAAAGGNASLMSIG